MNKMKAQSLFLALLVWAPSIVCGFAFRYRCPSPIGGERATVSRRRHAPDTCCMLLPSMRAASDARKLVGTLIVGSSLLTGLVFGADMVKADVLNSPVCIGGEGPQCDDMAQGNELIKSLQAKSALSKAKYTQQMLDQYNERNFKDYFRAENKHMVRHKDGTYEILTNDDYVREEKIGKVKNDMFLEE